MPIFCALKEYMIVFFTVETRHTGQKPSKMFSQHLPLAQKLIRKILSNMCVVILC